MGTKDEQGTNRPEDSIQKDGADSSSLAKWEPADSSRYGIPKYGNSGCALSVGIILTVTGLLFYLLHLVVL